MKLSNHLFAISLPLLSVCAIAQEPPPVKAFFQNAQFHSPVLSPSGKHLAILVRNAEERMALAVLETAPGGKLSVIASYNNIDIRTARWVNDDRLYYDYEDKKNTESFLYGSAFAVNRDGSQRVQLMTNNPYYHQEQTGTLIKKKILPWDYNYIRSLPDGSDDILVEKVSYNQIDWSRETSRIYRMNTKSLNLTDQISGALPAKIGSWILDYQGQPVIGTSYEKGMLTIYHLDQPTQKWNQLAEFPNYINSGFSPEFIDASGNFYVRKGSKSGYAGLYAYDLKSRQASAEPLIEVAGFDYDGLPVLDRQTGDFLGVRYQGDAYDTAWVNPKMKALQQKIDEKLPGTINTISCGNCLNSATYLVTADSDRLPSQYLLYRPEQDELSLVGSPNPDIKAEQMGNREFVRIEARDKLPIPTYITKPATYKEGTLPTVVLVHGGPYVRGSSWEWDAEAQFLASRGYLVIQPEFRGSTGFGFKHFQAGWKQWGQAMQDDIADATKWAITQGLADPKRIAIAGASYGGYATLMGLVRYPELYRAGVNWIGISDINLWYDISWSDLNNQWLSYGMPVLIGDQTKDAAMLKQNSPLERAAEIKQPLLMAYGAQDVRVPLPHGTKFRDAVRQHNKQVEWVVYPEEGHGWYLEKNRLDFYQRMESFLDKHVKQAK